MQQLTFDTPYVVGRVQAYLAEIDAASVLFDCGPDTPEARQLIDRTFPEAGPDFVLLTHWHPDHSGLASYLADSYGTEVLLSRIELERLESGEKRVQQVADLLGEMGFPEAQRLAVAALFRKLNQFVPLPRRFRIIEDSADLLRQLNISYSAVKWHSQSDLIFEYGNYAIAGDVFLKGIFSSPLFDVDLSSENGSRFRNYVYFCRLIENIGHFDKLTILPAHNREMTDVSGWCVFYVTKLINRLKKLASALRSGVSLYDVVRQILPDEEQSPFMLYAKISDVLFARDLLDDPDALVGAIARAQLTGRLEEQVETLYQLQTERDRTESRKTVFLEEVV